MTPTVAFIPVSQVSVPAYKTTERSAPSEKETQELANSIQMHGLLQPIGVVKAGTRFRIVWGRRRLKACEQLGLEQIEAKVYDTLDEAMLSQMEWAENLFRTELTPAQRLMVLKRWLEAYNAWLEASRASKPAPEPEPAEEVDEEPEAETGNPAPPAQDRLPHKAVQKFAQDSGLSHREAQRDLKAAQALTDNQLRVLDIKKVPRVDIETIAAVKDPVERNRICNLIAMDIPSRQAIAEVMNPDGGGTIRLADGRKVSVESEGKAISDDEWVKVHCRSIRDKLANPAIFDKAAASWRRCEELCKDFYKAISPVVRAARRSSERVDPFAQKVAGVCSIMHPSYWLTCGECNATGQVDDAACDVCGGGGFHMKTDPIR